MNEYRCTRSDLYSHNCLGRDNLKARQGHYIQAVNAKAALRVMQLGYPDEVNFTVDQFK